MSTTLEPARTNYSTPSLDAFKVSASEGGKPTPRPSRVIKFHKVQKKNKQAVASLMCKTIKESFDTEMLSLIEPYHSVRLTAAIRNSFIDNYALSISNAKADLEQFDFNSSSTFDHTVKTKFFVKGGSHNGYAILHVPAFVPVNELDVPNEATNFKISCKLISISDFKFSKELNSYVPENMDAHGQSGTFETTMLPVLRMQTQPITAQVCIDKCKPMEKGVHTLLVAAVKFYSYDHGKFVHLTEKGSMKIMKLF